MYLKQTELNNKTKPVIVANLLMILKGTFESGYLAICQVYLISNKEMSIIKICL